MTLRAVLYQALSDRLLELPEIKWVDFNTGQLDEPQSDYPMPLPAVIVNIGKIDYTDISDSVKEATAEEITLTVIHHNLENTFTGRSQKTANIAWLNLNESISEYIDGLENEYFSPFSLVSETRIASDASTQVFEFVFQTRASLLKDESLSNRYIKLSELTLNPEPLFIKNQNL